MRFHLKDDGEPAVCKAKTSESCPKGGSHFENSESAREFFEKTVESELELPRTFDCDEIDDSDYMERSERFVNSLDSKTLKFLEDYSQQDYEEVNRKLWNGEIVEIFKSSESLSKSRGDVRSLWRYPPRSSVTDLVENKKIGDSIELKGFSSTVENPRKLFPLMRETGGKYLKDSEDPDDYVIETEGENGTTNVVLQFLTSKGGEVSRLSHMTQEHETLLPPSSKWKIVGIKETTFRTDKDMFGEKMRRPEERTSKIFQLMEDF